MRHALRRLLPPRVLAREGPVSEDDTPLTGSIPSPRPGTDKFQLAVIVNRLEAQMAALKVQIDCLEESDEDQNDKIATLTRDLEGITHQVSTLVNQIRGWRQESANNDANHAARLASIERRLAGFGGILVVLQLAFEAYKAAHGH